MNSSRYSLPSSTCSLLQIGLAVLAFIGFCRWSFDPLNKGSHRFRLVPPSAEEIADDLAYDRRVKDITAGGEFSAPLSMMIDLPGITNPKLIARNRTSLSDLTPVVGIIVGGSPFAFALSSMRNVEEHVINLVIGGDPVSVTYCDKTDCVRVLRGNGETPIPLGVAGLDVNGKMVFLLDDVPYTQDSSKLPLADHPHQRTRLGKWMSKHPKSKIYVGQANACGASLRL